MLHVKHNKIIAEKLNILNLVKNISQEINIKNKYVNIKKT